MPTVYAAMNDALLVADGAPGDGWAVTERLRDRNLDCLDVHPDAPERVFCGTYESGLQRSTDGGDTFERVGEAAVDPDEDEATARRREVDGVSVMSVAVDHADPDVVWAGTEPSAVFRSTDGGDTWERKDGLTDLDSEPEWAFPPRPYTHHVRWLEVDREDPDHLYVSIEAGALVQTRDAGETWEDRVPGARRDNHSLTTHPDAPDRAWAAAGDGYAETRDAGEAWDHPQEGLGHRYCWSVAVDATDPDTVLLSAATSASRAHGHGGVESAESYVYRKRGDGPWERADADLPAGEGFLRAVLEAGGAAGEFYLLSNRGPYRTTDAGESWERLDWEWPDRFAGQAPSGLAVV